MLLAARAFFFGTPAAPAPAPVGPSVDLQPVLDRIIADRITRNEQRAVYELPAVRRAEVRRGQFFADGRYVGELGADHAYMAERLVAGHVTVRGRFEHLSFVIEHVSNS